MRTADRDAGAVVALGDSITNGANTKPNTNHRWPDVLSNRLSAVPFLRDVGVMDHGVAGNRLPHDPNPPPGSDAVKLRGVFGQNALARFYRHVLAQPRASHVVVLLRVNDLGHPGNTAPAERDRDRRGDHRGPPAAHRALARGEPGELRRHHPAVQGDTLGFHTEADEAKRQAVNAWMRTSGEYDAVIDFDAAMRDPADPQRLRAAYDSGDHPHPYDAGMAAMAAAVPLPLFR